MSNKKKLHQKLVDLLDQELPFSRDELEKRFAYKLEHEVGKFKHNINDNDIYQALALSIRDFLLHRWNTTQELIRETKAKRLYYISMEFLIGRLAKSNLLNLGMEKHVREAIEDVDFTYNDILDQEHDAGLGNGGLGRLAACFIDSMATLDLPCYGSCLRYEYGIFQQLIEQGYQAEVPDAWLRYGNPWEIMRPDLSYPVGFYGHTEFYTTETGDTAVRWVNEETVLAQAYDILVPGFNTRTVTNLRLYAAKATSEFDFNYFNQGDYFKAVEDKQRSENISRVLYPNENSVNGRELRLKQEYLLVAATLADAMRTFLEEESDLHRLPQRLFFQLNDTHPALAVPELMRILVDLHHLKWKDAWQITVECFGYTNHTIMPEALEKWNLPLFKKLLPRHMEIVYEINFRFLESIKDKALPHEVLNNLSIIEEGSPQRIRMANLAVIGSKKVNGVAELHSNIIKEKLFHDFYSLTPSKFQNKTNGITFRRWLMLSNPKLTELINSAIGTGYIDDQEKLHELADYAGDSAFQKKWDSVKRTNKIRLAEIIKQDCGVEVSADFMFDVQVKRIHEYKRQLLNIMRVISDYHQLKADPSFEVTPRCVIFAGKAAPGYHMAKMIIKLITSVADVINNDAKLDDRLKVIFLPNYRVSLAEYIFRASDLSEQISTAGTEASGTGNMKFMLNGALTIGTLDGANIEIMEEAGAENMYTFGLDLAGVEKLRSEGYDPLELYHNNEMLGRVLNAIRGNFFSLHEPGIFQEIFQALTDGGDHYLVLKDFESYAAVQRTIDADYLDRPGWLRKSIMNTSAAARFSSDRTIKQYAEDIWKIKPVRQPGARVDALKHLF